MDHTPEELLAWFDLEQIDRDIFRGRPGVWPADRVSLYGGEVAAQALAAAAETVPDGRSPHSLHGYFLRRGDPRRPVVFMVDRDRDGRSFSARRVAALQGGEVIWEMACSFTEPVDGPQFVVPSATAIPGPDESAPLSDPWTPFVDVRLPPAADGSASVPMPVDRAWLRVKVPLGDDPLVHACMHVYTSDVTTGFADLALAGTPPAGPSIDHALWFHHISRADEWVLYDCTPAKVGGHRGLYTGTAHDLEGNLVAMLAQEMLLRPTDDAV